MWLIPHIRKDIQRVIQNAIEWAKPLDAVRPTYGHRPFAKEVQ